MTRKKTIPEYYLEVIKGKRKGIAPFLMLVVCKIVSYFYYTVVRSILGLYSLGIKKKCKLPCFVISLGNITVGGTGKTPTAERIATQFRDSGYKVTILNRGYRGSWRGKAEVVSDGEQIYMTAPECGDEAYLLAANLPGVSVVIGRDRYVSGELAIRQLGTEVLILDDGFQHWHLERDLDIVLIDATDSLLNNHILPYGTMREPISSLSRADIVLLTKTEHAAAENIVALDAYFREHLPRILVVETSHAPESFVNIEDWYAGHYEKSLAVDTLSGQKALVFSALGNPGAFEDSVSQLVGDVCQKVQFPDHHAYTMAELQRILIRAVASGANCIITTEKDAVKIPSEFIHRQRKLPIYVLRISVRTNDDANYDRIKERICREIRNN